MNEAEKSVSPRSKSSMLGMPSRMRDGSESTSRFKAPKPYAYSVQIV